MNIVSDQGSIHTPSSDVDISVWKSIFPQWHENDQAQENLKLDPAFSTINTNSANRKVFFIL